jgi:predicted branched-subunit amino acid permease
MTLVGALAGQAIPPEYALDFAVPIAFIAVIAPLMRTLPHLVAALTSIAGTLALTPLPYNTGLLVAAVLAMAAGAETERRLERRRA